MILGQFLTHLFRVLRLRRFWIFKKGSAVTRCNLDTTCELLHVVVVDDDEDDEDKEIRMMVVIVMVMMHIYARWSDGMWCCRSNWPGLCFLCCSTIVCCQTTELIWGFFFCCFVFINFQFLLPPPPPAVSTSGFQ